MNVSFGYWMELYNNYLMARLLGRYKNLRSGSRVCGFLLYNSTHNLITLLKNERLSEIE